MESQYAKTHGPDLKPQLQFSRPAFPQVKGSDIHKPGGLTEP